MIQQIMAVLILATIFSGIALVVGVVFWGLKGAKGLPGRSSSQQLEEETRIIQEIYKGLNKMEERIEALETILCEQQQYSQQSPKEHDDEKI